MSINIAVDGNTYTNKDEIQVGGKTLTLSEAYSGTKEITANGTHDVSGYASASVNVPTSGSESTPVLVATATPDTSTTSGTLTFSDVSLEANAIYKLLISSEPTNTHVIVEGAFITYKTCTRLTGIVVAKDDVAAACSPTGTLNDDGTYTFTITGAGSTRITEEIAYNLYKVGTFE